MAAPSFASRPHFRITGALRWGVPVLGVVTLWLIPWAADARAQAAAEYAGATGVSASTVASKPQVFNPGGALQPNMSLFLAKPAGPPPEVANRKWFEQQAGKDGGRLSIDATPAHASVWIDGKYVGRAPVSVSLPPGKHQVSLLGPRQENTRRDVEITAGQDQKLTIELKETYPTAVSISVFGNQPH
ncbi:MAG TPA: PEGA domain-containing protein [Candidatus Acidoferrales bacterium]|nr:PEGA domain-containing protein [Candidatus Acidoferrales bacterium]